MSAGLTMPEKMDEMDVSGQGEEVAGAGDGGRAKGGGVAGEGNADGAAMEGTAPDAEGSDVVKLKEDVKEEEKGEGENEQTDEGTDGKEEGKGEGEKDRKDEGKDVREKENTEEDGKEGEAEKAKEVKETEEEVVEGEKEKEKEEGDGGKEKEEEQEEEDGDEKAKKELEQKEKTEEKCQEEQEVKVKEEDGKDDDEGKSEVKKEVEIADSGEKPIWDVFGTGEEKLRELEDLFERVEDAPFMRVLPFSEIDEKDWTIENLVERAYHAYVGTRLRTVPGVDPPRILPLVVDVASDNPEEDFFEVIGFDVSQQNLVQAADAAAEIAKRHSLPKETERKISEQLAEQLERHQVRGLPKNPKAATKVEATAALEQDKLLIESDPSKMNTASSGVHPSEDGQVPGSRSGNRGRGLKSTRGIAKLRSLKEDGLATPSKSTKATSDKAISLAQPSPLKDEDRRIVSIWLEVDDVLGNRRVLKEDLEWDFSGDEEMNSPEWFAWYLCEENGLGANNVRLVANHIRMKLLEAKAHAAPTLPSVVDAQKDYNGTAQEKNDAYSTSREIVYGLLDNALKLVDLAPNGIEAARTQALNDSQRSVANRVESENEEIRTPMGARMGAPLSKSALSSSLHTPFRAQTTPASGRSTLGKSEISPKDKDGVENESFTAPPAAIYGLTLDNRPFKDQAKPLLDMLDSEGGVLVCSFAGCLKRFKEPVRLQKHEAVHYDVREEHHLLGRLSLLDDIDEEDLEERDPRREERLLMDSALPHRCPYVGCGKGFYFPSQLQRHKVYHEKEGHALRSDMELADEMSQLHGFSRGSSYSTRRSNPLPPVSGDRLGLGLRASPKAKFLPRKERKETTPRVVKPAKPPPPMINAVVHGVDLRVFRLHAYKKEELISFRDGKTKPRHNHAKGGGCIPCKIKVFGLDFNKMRDIVRVFLRELRKMRGEPPEEEPPVETDQKQDPPVPSRENKKPSEATPAPTAKQAADSNAGEQGEDNLVPAKRTAKELEGENNPSADNPTTSNNTEGPDAKKPRPASDEKENKVVDEQKSQPTEEAEKGSAEVDGGTPISKPEDAALINAIPPNSTEATN